MILDSEIYQISPQTWGLVSIRGGDMTDHSGENLIELWEEGKANGRTMTELAAELGMTGILLTANAGQANKLRLVQLPADVRIR